MNTPGGKLLQCYLMSSFLYYRMNRSPITDAKYDNICKKLKQLWGTFEHPHKYLVTLEDLEAGTGYAISHYPTIVQQAAMVWWSQIENEHDYREEYAKSGYLSA